jgi:DNA-binding transcriptional LysR family regulator
MFETLFNRSGLSLDRLRSFLEMAQAGGIAKAAPNDATRQSLISRQIKELEVYFGTELTRRKGKILSLSPAGERLATLIREQLQDLEDFRREQEKQPKVFTVGAGASTLEWLVTPHLPKIAEILGGAMLRTELRRSRPLVEGVQEGRVDFGILRKDAIPDASRHNCKAIMKLTFHLCIPRRLVKHQLSEAQLLDPVNWRSLPFAAGRDNGQMDLAVREGMRQAGVDFKPKFECGSMLQVSQLVKQGQCAAVLPDLALPGLDARTLFIVPFTPLSNYGRQLVLHWNARQMSRRGVEPTCLRQIAELFQGT